MVKKTVIISLAVLIGVLFGGAIAFAQTTTVTQERDVLLPSSESVSVPETDLQLGHKNVSVKRLKEALKALGYFPSDFKPNKYFGRKTREALIKFQKDNNLPASGFFGPLTRQALKRLLLAEAAEATTTKIDLNCMKTAVEKRENSLISAYTTYTDKVKTARETRKSDLLNAWTIENWKERRAAINQAWINYRKSVRSAHLEWISARKSAWSQFEIDRKQCKAPATGEAETLEIVPETTE
jgi:hypothetical protein